VFLKVTTKYNIKISRELRQYCGEIGFTSYKSAHVNNNAIFSIAEEIDKKIKIRCL
jgi:hypothetical protein